MEKDKMICCKFCKFYEEKFDEFNNSHFCRYYPTKVEILDPYQDWCGKYKFKGEKENL